jgi:hypothetical protein
MDYVTIAAGDYELGWRYTDALSSSALAYLDSIAPGGEWRKRFSPPRRVRIAAFEIAATTLRFEELLGDPYDIEADSLDGLCSLIDQKLSAQGLRLPSEDEFESACGGSLFSWGIQIPDGLPRAGETTFRSHSLPNAAGLLLNADPYNVEICRTALKLGDGGTSICGDEPEFMAWLALSPSFRLVDADIADYFAESLETALIRPIKRASTGA